MRWALLVVGILAILVGAVWTLQGLGVLGGSVMTGQKIWVIIGPIVIVAGLIVARIGARRRPTQ
jgi:hypothetical protein